MSTRRRKGVRTGRAGAGLPGAAAGAQRAGTGRGTSTVRPSTAASRRTFLDPSLHDPARLDPAAIDALYGLEPVFEPDAPAVGDGSTPWVTIECPYCWEPYDTQLDLSAGSQTYVEDCQICCRPIELGVAVNDAGELESVRPARMD